MGLFGKGKSNNTVKAPMFAKGEVPTPKGVGKVVKQEIETQVNTGVKNTAFFAHDVIIFPRVTEKSHNVAHLRQYAFNVRKDSNKETVKKAIEHIYNVKVEKVRTSNVPAKKRRMGKVVGKKAGYKKAIVTLKEGFSIEVTP